MLLGALYSTRYEDPHGRYFADFAAPWRRAGAAAVDWTLCAILYLLASIPLGAVQAAGLISQEDHDLGGIPGRVVVYATEALVAAPLVAYFTLLLPTSDTFGMRAMQLRIVSLSRGRAPGRIVAVLRAVLASAVAISVYLTVLVATSYSKPRDLDTASVYALHVAHGLFAFGVASAVLMIVTPTHRSAVDRLFGTAVIENLEAVKPRLGPWGPLDSFDLSARAESSEARSR
jgi:uncharacterized RDD family membrane protein YckC